MKILVTGGTGFLGRHLVWRLAGAGHQIVFTGRNESIAAQVIEGAPSALFVSVDHGSHAAANSIRQHAEGAAAIIHCAALASPWGTRPAFTRANIASTREVLAACAEHSISRLVHISSPSVYFTYADRLGIVEDAPLPAPVNEYARSKRVAEELVQAAKLSGAVILRPRAIFGPWDNALLPRLLRLMRYGRVPLLRGGRALIDLTYVDNVIDAIELGLALPGQGKTPVFNITNGEPVEAGALFAQIAQQFGLPVRPVNRPYGMADFAARALEVAARLAPGWEPPITRYSIGAIAFSQTLNLDRARNILGYRPRVSLAEGIARTAKWWTERHRAP